MKILAQARVVLVLMFVVTALTYTPLSRPPVEALEGACTPSTFSKPGLRIMFRGTEDEYYMMMHDHEMIYMHSPDGRLLENATIWHYDFSTGVDRQISDYPNFESLPWYTALDYPDEPEVLNDTHAVWSRYDGPFYEGGSQLTVWDRANDTIVTLLTPLPSIPLYATAYHVLLSTYDQEISKSGLAVYELSSNQFKSISSEGRGGLIFDGNRIAYYTGDQNNNSDIADVDIWLYEFGSEQPKKIRTTDAYNAWSWAFGDDIVVWYEHREGLMIYDILNDQLQTLIIDGSVGNGDRPILNANDIIAWMSRTQEYGSSDIYLYNRTTDTIIQLTDTIDTTDFLLNIVGNVVAYRTNQSFYFYNVVTQQTTSLTIPAGLELGLHEVRGQWLVAQLYNEDEGTSELYLYNYVVGGSFTQLTDTDDYERNFYLTEDFLLWQPEGYNNPNTEYIVYCNLVPIGFEPLQLNPIVDQNATENTQLTVNATTSGGTGDISFALEGNAPAGMTISNAGVITWTPDETQGGSAYTFDVVATDDTGKVRTAVTVGVAEDNQPPSLAAIPAQSVQVGQPLSLSITATDPDIPAQALTYTLTSAPDGMSINPATGVLSWMPPAVGAYTATVQVSDAGSPALTASQPLAVTVTESDTVELLREPGFEGEMVAWTLKGRGTQGDKIRCNKLDRPNGKPDKIFSHTGDCAFRFRGRDDGKSRIQQNVDLSGVTFSQGDVLTLSGYVDAAQGSVGRVRLRVKYNDSTPTDKLNFDLTTTTDGYEPFDGSLTISSAAISKIQVQVRYNASSSKAYVDDIHLTKDVTTTPAPVKRGLPVPTVPASQ